MTKERKKLLEGLAIILFGSIGLVFIFVYQHPILLNHPKAILDLFLIVMKVMGIFILLSTILGIICAYFIYRKHKKNLSIGSSLFRKRR